MHTCVSWMWQWLGRGFECWTDLSLPRGPWVDRGGKVLVPVEERSSSNIVGGRAVSLFYKKGIVPHLISENMLSPHQLGVYIGKSVNVQHVARYCHFSGPVKSALFSVPPCPGCFRKVT